ncbi:hypothetical protein CTAYLR_004579 [Chrysophaeum taylorii]|uniref:Uncharacterized protein n=1 Tax=Chrysophaeum taylorii TaxID=2483200 RepID=A0AAD7UEB4_9STRA|nr:hypothetical protein CTAYLR_004579 [Chrysophaeum taylorii]
MEASSSSSSSSSSTSSSAASSASDEFESGASRGDVFWVGARVRASALAFGEEWAAAHEGEKFGGVITGGGEGAWRVKYDDDGEEWETPEGYLEVVETKRASRVNYNELVLRRAVEDRASRAARRLKEKWEEMPKKEKKMKRSSTRVAARANYYCEEEEEEEEAAHKKRRTTEDEDALEVERILSRARGSAVEWKKVMSKMNTKHVTNGSVWAQEDAEKEEEEERFLIKWKRLSYLHVSWESEVDLREQIGEQETKRAMTHLSKRNFVESMVPADSVDAATTEVERVLDVETDEGVWVSGLKKAPWAAAAAAAAEVDPLSVIKAKVLTVKWRGLGYSEASDEVVEDLDDDDDLQTAVASCCRRYFPAKKKKKRKGALLLRGSNKARREEVKDAVPRTPCRGGGLELRDYQVEGAAWLSFNMLQKRNCILADEMGLGKTVQTVTLVRVAKEQACFRNPALVVAPLSTLPHWQREFSRWSSLDVAAYHGSAADRAICEKNDILVRGGRASVDVVLTTYEQLLLSTTLDKHRWSVVVVDEAHRLKNPNSRLYKTLSDWDSSSFKLLLTGTPLQNDVQELWSLLSFCDPHKFSDAEDFAARYSNLSSEEEEEKGGGSLGSLLEVMQPYVLRREKAHVEEKVPPKSEIVVDVALSATQRRYYKALYERNASALVVESETTTAAAASKRRSPGLANLAMELRKCCNHPYLLEGVEGDELVGACGKLQFLDKLLPRLRDQKSRVLIFSQFTTMLDVLEDYLSSSGFSYGRIDGQVTGRERQRQIDAMGDLFVMLLSTRAGGVGINLVAADTVIIYDSDWNPQNDIQAMARCHRIGQTKRVTVYRLITRGTYEAHMYDVATAKLSLDRAVLDGIAGRKKSLLIGDEEEELLLKRGVGAAFKEEEDFSNQDIDAILATRTREVSVKGSALESLSTATFVQQEDLDDPDFWSKTLGPLPPKAAAAAAAASAGAAGTPAKKEEKRARRAMINYAEDDTDWEEDSDDSRGKRRRLENRYEEWSKSHASELKSRLAKKPVGSTPEEFVEGSKELAFRAQKTSASAVLSAARRVVLLHAGVVARGVPGEAARLAKKNRAVRAALQAAEVDEGADLAAALEAARAPPGLSVPSDVKASRNVLQKYHELEVARLMCERLDALEDSCRASPRPKKMTWDEKLVIALDGNDPPDRPPTSWWRARHDCALVRAAKQRSLSRVDHLDLFLDPTLPWPEDIRTQVRLYKDKLDRSENPPLPSDVPRKDRLRDRLKDLVAAAENTSNGRVFDRDRKQAPARAANAATVKKKPVPPPPKPPNVVIDVTDSPAEEDDDDDDCRVLEGPPPPVCDEKENGVGHLHRSVSSPTIPKKTKQATMHSYFKPTT